MFILTGCEEKISYSYLMEHPQKLQKEVEKCEENNSATEECKIVSYAANNVMMLINEQQADPEKFGDKLLQQQTELGELKIKINSAQQKLSQLKMQKENAEKIKAAQNNLEEMQKQYQDQYQEVKYKLAVIGLASPE